MADNKEIVRSIEEAWDRSDLGTLDQYFAPDFVAHEAVPGLPRGLERLGATPSGLPRHVRCHAHIRVLNGEGTGRV